MSDTPQGPGWWQASDFKWYPPSSAPSSAPSEAPHPTNVMPPIEDAPAPPVYPTPPFTAPTGPPQFGGAIAPGTAGPPPQSGPASFAPPASPPTHFPAAVVGAPPPFGGTPGPPPPPGAPGFAPPKTSNNSRVLLILLGVFVLLAGGCIALVVATRDSTTTASSTTTKTTTAIDPTATLPGGPNATFPTGGTGIANGGSHDSPLPMGSEVDLGNGWKVKVVSADTSAGASQAVDAANQFNDPAPDGMRYVIINLSATFAGRDGKTTESPFFGFDYSVFGSDNVERNGFETIATPPAPEFDMTNELATGGTATGNIVVTVGANETNLSLRLTPSFSFNDDEAWIKLG